ncbi:hypothetical protein KAH43_04585 [Candidatus Bipolaricaulota bacterium]|nr:hypothetical protein [Candidatus Bipolaricaulota bacterium]
MRIRKAFGMTMLVAGLVLGLAVTVVAASDSVTVNASFTVPSWISLSVLGDGNVGFGDIAGGGGYSGDNTTDLRVLSTTSWAITSSILWSNPATIVPAGASTVVIETALGIPYSTSGTWGISSPVVSYTMNVTDDDMVSLPVGNYNLVIQYTATTD